MTLSSNQIYEFGPFRLDRAERVLLRSGKPVPVPPKAFEVLLTLVERSGHIVEKDELLNRVWADSFVEEGNLKVTVSMLRKTLEDDAGGFRYIETVSKRGYRFIAEVRPLSYESRDLVMREVTRSTLTIEEDNGSAETQGTMETQAVSRSTGIRDAKLRKRYLTVALVMLGLAVGSFATYEFTGGRQSRPIGAFQTMRISRITSSGRVGSASISPDGKYVAYEEDNSEGWQALWVKQIATGTTLQIVPPDEVVYRGTTFSNDGNLVYYTVKSAKNPSGALYQVPVIGGPVKKLLTNISGSITQSPDGARIAFVYHLAGSESLMIANANGTEANAIARRIAPDHFYAEGPAWSPDGKTIACGGLNPVGGHDASLFAVKVDSGEVTRLTPHQWRGVRRVCWLGDGSGLVVIAFDPAQDFSQLWEVSYPSGEARRITNDLNDHADVDLSLTANSSTIVTTQKTHISNIWITPVNGDAGDARQLTSGEGRNDGGYGLSWLVDGRLLYTSVVTGNWDIWRMKTDGSEQRQLTFDAYVEEFPVVTPDGSAIVFKCGRADGTPHIWSVDADGSQLKQLTNGNDHSGRVSPDGKWIVYSANSSGMERLWKAPIDGGTPIQLTDYKSQWPDVSPDGRLIVSAFFTDGPNQSPSQIAIVSFSGGPPIKIIDLPPTANNKVHWTPDSRAVAYIDTRVGVANIWSQPLDGSPPKPLTNFTSGLIFNFEFSRDAKQIACARGTNTSDVVLITSIK